MVVVGGGFGGATAARYLKMRAAGVQVTLIEPSEGERVVSVAKLGEEDEVEVA